MNTELVAIIFVAAFKTVLIGIVFCAEFRLCLLNASWEWLVEMHQWDVRLQYSAVLNIRNNNVTWSNLFHSSAYK